MAPALRSAAAARSFIAGEKMDRSTAGRMMTAPPGGKSAAF